MIQRGLVKIVNKGLFEKIKATVEHTHDDGGSTYKFLSSVEVNVPNNADLVLVFAGSRGGACSMHELRTHSPLLAQLLDI